VSTIFSAAIITGMFVLAEGVTNVDQMPGGKVRWYWLLLRFHSLPNSLQGGDASFVGLNDV
jgi:hypothetical protein